MMKILMILENTFPPDIRVENEIHSLKKAGHEVTLACRSKGDDRGENKTFDGNKITIIRKHMPKLIYKSSIAHP